MTWFELKLLIDTSEKIKFVASMSVVNELTDCSRYRLVILISLANGLTCQENINSSMHKSGHKTCI